jgi:hypothetical protein
VFTRKSISLIAVVTALGVLGVSATSAWATEVKPASGTAVAKSTNATFIPANAFSEGSVVCSSSATITIPEEGAQKKNQNKAGTGTFSTGDGSVLLGLKPPSFTSCSLKSGGVTVAPAEVTTRGEWAASAYNSEAMSKAAEGAGAASIGVPKEGATISIPAFGCTIIVATNPNVVTALVQNDIAGEGAATGLAVDGQITFTASAGCAAIGLEGVKQSPAQFEADYKVSEGKLLVLP